MSILGFLAKPNTDDLEPFRKIEDWARAAVADGASEAAMTFAKLDRSHQANLYRRLYELADGTLGSLGDVDRPNLRWAQVGGCSLRFELLHDFLLVLALKLPPDE